MAPSARSAAVLLSGGADSAVLLGDALRRYRRVVPVFVESGLRWEKAERAHVGRLLKALRSRPGGRRLAPLRRLTADARDLLPPAHWARGGSVPDADAPWDSVYLPGRNLLLLSKAAVLAAGEKADDVLIGTLASNPFGDSKPAFFRALEKAARLALGTPVRLKAPFAGLSKSEVLRRGRDLPLGLTFSCLRPKGLRHCGRCTKCFERREAFRGASLPDPTDYLG